MTYKRMYVTNAHFRIYIALGMFHGNYTTGSIVGSKKICANSVCKGHELFLVAIESALG